MNGNHLEPAPKPFPACKRSSTRSKQRDVIARLSNILRRRARKLSVAGSLVCAWGVLSLSLAMAVIAHHFLDSVSCFASQEFANVRTVLLENEVAILLLISNARDARDRIPTVIENIAQTIRSTKMSMSCI